MGEKRGGADKLPKIISVIYFSCFDYDFLNYEDITKQKCTEKNDNVAKGKF